MALADNYFSKKTSSKIIKCVSNTLDKNKFFYIRIFGNELFKCKANKASEETKHTNT